MSIKMSSINKMNVENYSEKSCVLRGEETKQRTEEIKALGGKWNSRLQGGGGWIFPMFKKESVEKWILYISSAKQIPIASYSPEMDTDCSVLEELLRKVNRMEQLLLQFMNTIEVADAVEHKEEEKEKNTVVNAEDEDEDEEPRFHKRLL
jgi:hypothetical protein